MYKVWIQKKFESLHNSTMIRTRGEVDALFAALQQASEGGGEVDGDQWSGDPLPGVLDAVLVQALASQPPFWLL
jgi:hypothetical protein